MPQTGFTTMKQRTCLALVSILTLSLVLGCQNGATTSPTESSNLKPLAVMYGRFISSNQGRGPKDEQELKEFIKSQPSQELSNLGVTDVESLFVSARDKKPYKLKFDPVPAVPGQTSNIFAWEQVGIQGKRYVAGTLGEIMEVDENKFRQLVPNP